MTTAGAMSRPGTLYLIPNLLGETSLEQSLPQQVARVTALLKHFLVEDEKSARRLIKQLHPAVDLRSLRIERLNEHTKADTLRTLFAPLADGMMSELSLRLVARLSPIRGQILYALPTPWARALYLS